MINEQIAEWIWQNHEVYLRGGLKQQLKVVFSGDHAKSGIKKIISKYMEIMEKELKEGNCVVLNEVVSFASVKVKNIQDQSIKMKVKFKLEGKLKNVIESCPFEEKPKNPKQVHSCPEISRVVSSLLLVDFEIVSQIMIKFSRAILDLILSGKKIALDFGFCLMNLSKSKSSCVFRTYFLKQLNHVSQAPTKRNEGFANRYRPKLESFDLNQENQRWKSCWNEIKDGNLFDYPSLREIKDYFDKGYDLEIRYKEIFEPEG